MLKFTLDREDPNAERHLHPTFVKKAKPELQTISQTAHFDSESRNSSTYKYPANADSIQAIPVTWDTVYDPSHPDADWSGLVKRDALFTKKHITNHRSQRENVEYTENGIVSKETEEEARRNRLLPKSTNSGGSIVIGGIDAPDDRWKTTYRRFQSQESTSKDQLTMDKRVNPIKRIPDPAQSRSIRSAHDDGYEPSWTGEFDRSSREISPRAVEPRFTPRSSLLSGMGEQLLNSHAVQPPPQQSKTAYRSEEYRTMVADNYKPFPGTVYCL